jgi:hypothetical protein
VAKAYRCDYCHEYYLPWELKSPDVQVWRSSKPEHQEPQGHETYGWAVPDLKMMFVDYDTYTSLHNRTEWKEPDLCKPCYINALTALVEAI